MQHYGFPEERQEEYTVCPEWGGEGVICSKDCDYDAGEDHSPSCRGCSCLIEEDEEEEEYEKHEYYWLNHSEEDQNA